MQGRSSVVEQRPFKPKVVGSIPTAPTNPIDWISKSCEGQPGRVPAMLSRNQSLPSFGRGFDSHRPLQILKNLGSLVVFLVFPNEAS
jgi:hypothetical protein